MKSGWKHFYTGIGAALVFGWLIFPHIIYRSVYQPVQFSHVAHTGDNVRMTCGDCHAFEKDGRFLGIPATQKCAGCHAETMGVSKEEERIVEEYIKPGKEIPWVVYSRQPENVYFSHATHVKLAGIECQSCHFGHAYTRNLRPARFDRLSGYSLDVLGKSLFNSPSTQSRGMRMDDCVNCHRQRGVKESCIECHK